MSMYETLRNLESREICVEYLKENYKTKKQLTALAKEIGVHVSSSMNKNEITRWIIDFTVGSRLQTESINSIDLSDGMRKFFERHM